METTQRRYAQNFGPVFAEVLPNMPNVESCGCHFKLVHGLLLAALFNLAHERGLRNGL